MDEGQIQRSSAFYRDGTTIKPRSPGDVLAAKCLIASLPIHYERDQKWQAKGTTGADRYTLQTPNQITINVNDAGYVVATQADLDLSATATWDAVSPDYRVAANRAGKDFYVYACQPSPTTDTAPIIICSANATYPSGYTASNSRKVGGFHCLCATISNTGHTLMNYVAGDILPKTIWDLKHRPGSSTVGRVYDEAIDMWGYIYLASGTGASCTSVYGTTVTDSRNWINFVDDGHAVKCRMFTDEEFQSLAAGTPEEAQVWNRSDPVTAGGHSAYFLLTLDVAPGTDWAAADTITGGTSGYTCTVVEKLTSLTYICKNISNAIGFTDGEILSNGTFTADQGAGYPTWAAHAKGRIVSSIGCEGCAGEWYQWLQTPSVRLNDGTASGWYNLPGAKGSLYTYGNNKYGNVQLLAGGRWAETTYCGSCCRLANSSRWDTNVYFGCRFGCHSKNT